VPIAGDLIYRFRYVKFVNALFLYAQYYDPGLAFSSDLLTRHNGCKLWFRADNGLVDHGSPKLDGSWVSGVDT
jgi:hypothetical protein